MTPNFNLPPGTLASDIDGPRRFFRIDRRYPRPTIDKDYVPPEPCPTCKGEGTVISITTRRKPFTCPTCGGLGIANQNTRP